MTKAIGSVKVSTKGQVVLPKKLREELGIRRGDFLEVQLRGQGILLMPARETPRTKDDWRSWRGFLADSDALQEHLEEHAREVRRERLP